MYRKWQQNTLSYTFGHRKNVINVTNCQSRQLYGYTVLYIRECFQHIPPMYTKSIDIGQTPKTATTPTKIDGLANMSRNCMATFTCVKCSFMYLSIWNPFNDFTMRYCPSGRYIVT